MTQFPKMLDEISFHFLGPTGGLGEGFKAYVATCNLKVCIG